ncbi:MAG: rod shape-determining protein RodA [Rhodospirillaceae bacterium]|jgi:rod shape determining protein RodA|nr:rod shape-determining protein RodA [Rhodospirillaceae bacterium]MBT5245241.1 rod shape-determining protein RodA [Rhodospirillaceae bacterium]MBT5562772.1 rod shape-determining protein RodA [Rhodospirillaceae bacterium]MBT6240701.1 rod shape-determining protein RodA [Rhodospirillaceae bacterium]
MIGDILNKSNLTLGQRLWRLHWLFVLVLIITATVGFIMLYSAANGSLEPWAGRQMGRFGIGLLAMLVVAMTNLRLWLKYSYAFYGVTLLLLGAVEFGGTIGMGAQRWIDLGVFNLQPSELMKIALVLALARYFHSGNMEDIGRPTYLIVPLLLVAAPTALVLRQPDLGTALMLVIGGGAIFFVAGIRIWKFALVFLAALISAPIGWQFLREYQKQRVLTFLNPESDPLGAGYHIIQSKIALGSGGLFGKGFMQGSQSHLSFLPEKQTDFIFTMLAEEFGLVGGLGLLGLYVLILAYCFTISLNCRNHFGRLVGMGVTTTFFLYVFINIAMVMGLIPVVGIPLPLISYGGTAMMTLLLGFGLLMSVHINRDEAIGRRGAADDF